ncbi:uncharacterized protein LOC124292848 [Neodiprion lecontei]|uniref:Uncharacterized protein LOC124292848 n=1 Tax=Neodiprion lecontei TaxID=441921 RepID=A0ABM3FGF7_NEOLC|nr:uncharacterized protein LOC124176649 [Neodiprion fabricii]XP_046587110.1 uncharacterized protein LOC124292848 [Neodiprion lecontei]
MCRTSINFLLIFWSFDYKLRGVIEKRTIIHRRDLRSQQQVLSEFHPLQRNTMEHKMGNSTSGFPSVALSRQTETPDLIFKKHEGGTKKKDTVFTKRKNKLICK